LDARGQKVLRSKDYPPHVSQVCILKNKNIFIKEILVEIIVVAKTNKIPLSSYLLSYLRSFPWLTLLDQRELAALTTRVIG
jgi:hypothetical protein